MASLFFGIGLHTFDLALRLGMLVICVNDLMLCWRLCVGGFSGLWVVAS